MHVVTVIVQSSEDEFIYCDCLDVCFLFKEKVVVVNESCLRLSLCV